MKKIILILLLLILPMYIFSDYEIQLGGLLGIGDNSAGVRYGPSITAEIDDNNMGGYTSYKYIFSNVNSLAEMNCLTVGLYGGRVGNGEWLFGLGYSSVLGGSLVIESEVHCCYTGVSCLTFGIDSFHDSITSDYFLYVGINFGIVQIGNVINNGMRQAAVEAADNKYQIEKPAAQAALITRMAEANAAIDVTITNVYSITKKEESPDSTRWDGHTEEYHENVVSTLSEDTNKTMNCAESITYCSQDYIDNLSTDIKDGLTVDKVITILPKGITDTAWTKTTNIWIPYEGTMDFQSVTLTCSANTTYIEPPILKQVTFIKGKIVDGTYGDYTIVSGRIARVGTIGDCISYRNTNGHAYKVISTDSDGRVTCKYFDWVDADTGFVWDGVVHTVHNN